MEKLLIFPCNGNGLEAVDCLNNQFDIIGFIDDDSSKIGKEVFGIKVFDRNILEKNLDAKVLALPGSPKSYLEREKIIQGLNVSKNRFATVIHPKASVSKLAKIGQNVLIMAGVVITSNSIIEDHVCILPNSIINHDTKVKKYTLIGSKVVIAGNTVVGENTYIGSGANIINGVSIGTQSLIGLGSNVISSVPNKSVFVGNPAKSISQ